MAPVEDHQGGPGNGTFRTIIVAVDDSEGSKAAFHSLCKVVRPESDRVIFLHVRRKHNEAPDLTNASEGLKDHWDTLALFEQAYARISKEILDKYLKMAQDAGIKGAEVLEMEGDARSCIADKCKEVNADLLVVGSRGKSVVARMFLGSVSSFCVHHAPCDVLLARAPHDS